MNELLKYLPVLMQIFSRYAKYAKYLIYLPTLFQLIDQAQKRFPKSGAGTEKRKWVSEQFSALVGLLEMSGILPGELAKALRDGIEAIVTAIVEVIKAAGGFNPDPLPVEPEPAVRYLLTFDPPVPDDAELKRRGYNTGDRISAVDDDSAWMMIARGRSTLGATILRTVT